MIAENAIRLAACLMLVILGYALSGCTEIIVKNCTNTTVNTWVDDTDDVKPRTDLSIPGL